MGAAPLMRLDPAPRDVIRGPIVQEGAGRAGHGSPGRAGEGAVRAVPQRPGHLVEPTRRVADGRSRLEAGIDPVCATSKEAKRERGGSA